MGWGGRGRVVLRSTRGTEIIWQVGFNVFAERYLLTNSNNHLSEKAFPMEFSAD